MVGKLKKAFRWWLALGNAVRCRLGITRPHGVRWLLWLLQAIWEPICWLVGRRPREPRPVRRVLFLALDNPGDVLLAAPCLTALAARFPDAQITVLAGPWNQEWLQAQPAVSQVLTYQAPWFAPFVRHLSHRPMRPVPETIRCLIALWRQRFDLVIETRGEAVQILLAYLTGAPRRVGYAVSSCLPWLRPQEVAGLLTDRVPYPWAHWFAWHQVEVNLQALAPLGIVRPADFSLSLTIPDEARQFAEAWWRRHGVGPGQVVIAVQPGASHARKRWPIERFAQVLNALTPRWGASVLLLGSSSERPFAEALAARLQQPPLSAVGQTTLLQAAALLTRCRLVIGNDSVMVHLASAVKTPVVSLSRYPTHRYAPWATRGVALSRPLACFNTVAHDGCHCPFSEYRCLLSVTPEAVVEAAERLISGVPLPAPRRTPPAARVVFDLRPLARPDSCFRGLGQYARGLFSGLRDIVAEGALAPFFDGEPLPAGHLLHLIEPDMPRGGLPTPAVATVCDLIPLIFPRDYLGARWRRGRARYQRYLECLTQAERLIAISQATRADLQRLLGIPADRIRVIYPGISPAFCATPDPEAPFELPFLIGIGSCERRKNIPRVIQAFARYRARTQWPGRLVLVGNDLFGHRAVVSEWARAAGVLDAVEVLPYLAPDELAALYRQAEALVFPSCYEGFGLPVIEAMACGTPVITSTVSALPEVVAGAALLVDPGSEEAMAQAIGQVVEDRRLRQRLREQGLARAAEFSWHRAAVEVVSTYRELAGDEL